MEKEIYITLKLLKRCYEKKLDIEEEIEHKGLDYNSVIKTIIYLEAEELVAGVNKAETLDYDVFVDLSNIRITLKGLEYLNENKLMKKIAKNMRDLKDIIK